MSLWQSAERKLRFFHSRGASRVLCFRRAATVSPSMQNQDGGRSGCQRPNCSSFTIQQKSRTGQSPSRCRCFPHGCYSSSRQRRLRSCHKSPANHPGRASARNVRQNAHAKPSSLRWTGNLNRSAPREFFSKGLTHRSHSDRSPPSNGWEWIRSRTGGEVSLWWVATDADQRATIQDKSSNRKEGCSNASN